MNKLNSLPVLGIILILLMSYTLCTAQDKFTVEVKGKGTPAIFIHGLFCSGDVWDDIISHYTPRYECHIITVAGFAGNAPALSDNFTQSVKDAIIAYVKDNNLNKPILIGHSMGAFLSLWAAATAPELFDRVVAVDGLPYLTEVQMPGASAEAVKSMAETMRNAMKNQTAEQIRQNQKMYLPMMIRDTDKIAVVSEMAASSHAPTQAQVMYELFLTDLREEVSAINCPVLLLGGWVAYKQYGVTRELALQRYTDQVKAIKNCTVVMSDTARHFLFYDEPEWFKTEVDKFLK